MKIEDSITLYNEKKNDVESHVKNIEEIVKQCGEALEGNTFYYHNTLTRYEYLVSKQINLFWCGSNGKTRICEIGFNAGHSALLLLLGRAAENTSSVEFTVFDICDHSYVRPCLAYIQSAFPDAKFELCAGDSIVEMPKWIAEHPDHIETYDVVHIDGGHSLDCIQNDLKNGLNLLKVGGYVIVDDTQIDYINAYANKVLETNHFVEVPIHQTHGYLHRILQRVK